MDSAIWGASVNWRSVKGAGFDAFAHGVNDPIFVLCDGANSCPNSGHAAVWLSQQVVTLIENSEQSSHLFDEGLRALHELQWEAFPDTAATLVCLTISEGVLHLSTVGDSSLHVYSKSWLGRWTLKHAMPIDTDVHGHPTQLVGSEVLHTIHHKKLTCDDPTLVLMMSDGPANALSSQTILKLLHPLSKNKPTPDDLNYVCQSITQEAIDAGCIDDATAILVWIEPS